MAEETTIVLVRLERFGPIESGCGYHCGLCTLINKTEPATHFAFNSKGGHLAVCDTHAEDLEKLNRIVEVMNKYDVRLRSGE